MDSRLLRLAAPQERQRLQAGLAFRQRALTLAQQAPRGEVPDDDMLTALWSSLVTQGVSDTLLQSLLKACQAEVQADNPPADFGALMSRCRELATPLGRMLLANPDERQQGYLDSLCCSLELAQHWLALANEHHAGQVFIPQDELAKMGLTPNATLPDDTLKVVLDAQILRTRRLLRSASPLGRQLGGRNGLALRAMILLVDRLLERKQRQGDPRYHPKASIFDLGRVLVLAIYHGLRR